MIGFFKYKNMAFTGTALALLAGILGTAGARNVAYAAGTQVGKSFTFRTLNDPADPTFNQLLGINNSGVITGYFGSGERGHPNRGYTLKPPYGQGDYTNENFPGSVQTQVSRSTTRKGSGGPSSQVSTTKLIWSATTSTAAGTPMVFSQLPARI